MAMARNVAIVIHDRSGAERAVHRVQYGARLKVDEGDQIKRGQRLAEWDPFTRPILTEIDGVDRLRGPDRRRLDVRAGRRGDRHRQAHGHRLALLAPHLRPQAGAGGEGPRRQDLRSCRAAATRATCCRWSRSSPSSRRARCGRATSSPASRSTRPRRATSPAVCRAWRNCSRRAVPRITRSSRRSPARCGSARTSRTSSA